MIEVKRLLLKKREKVLLKELSLELSEGSITLFLGKSGSGKTSLLRCLCQLENEYQGEIFYRGKEIRLCTPKERCQLIGFVSQSYALFPSMSVLDNCAHPLRVVLGFSKDEAYKKVEELAPTLDMEGLLSSYPHELSGGQQQRAAILRALLLNPRFLLLDEPTSALDPENTALLIQLLQRLKKQGKGIVIASQDMYFAQKMCEQAYFIEEGKIVEKHNFETEPFSKESQLGRFLFMKR